MIRPILLLAAAAPLAGCVAQGSFPSLAVRPAELEDWSEEPVRTAPAVAEDPALRARAAALLAEARAGDRAFQDELGGAERAVGRAGPPGSDNWVAAQEALSRLQVAGGRTSAAVEELHQLRRDRAERPTAAADLAALDAAIEAADAIAARQQARIARLSR